MKSSRDKAKAKAQMVSARQWAKEKDRQWEPTCVKLPDGTEFYKLEKVGPVQVDLMLYRIGKDSVEGEEGFVTHKREYKCHNMPGPDGKVKRYICRAGTFNPPRKCAFCDWLARKGGSADPQLVQQLRQGSRLLLVINDKPGNSKNKFKVFDTFYYMKKQGFGEQLKAVINTLDEDEEPFHWEGGYTAVFTVDELTMPTAKFKAVVRIDLRKRKYDYEESVLDLAPCLDDCLIDPGYKEMKELLEGGAAEQNGEGPKAEQGDEDEDTDDNAEDEDEQEGDEEESSDDDDEDEDEDEGDEEPAPKKGNKKAAAKQDDDDDEEDLDEEEEDDSDDEEDLDEDEDDEPPPPKKKGKGGKK